MKNVRNILNLFKIDKPSLDVILIGYQRIIITCFLTLKQLEAMIKYGYATDSLIFLLKDLEEVYQIDEEAMEVVKQIIIIIYHEN